MRRPLPLLAAAACVALGASLLSVRTGVATPFSSYSPPATSISLVGTDGGVPVLDVQGRNGGPVLTTYDGTQTFALAAESVASLAAPTCTVAALPPIITLTTTPQDVPAVPLSGRTQLLVKNLSAAQRIWCCQGAECTPTSTAAYVLLPSGDFQSFPVREVDVIRCRSAAGTADVNAQEASCG